MIKLLKNSHFDFMIVSAGIGDIVKYSFEHLFKEIGESIDLNIVSNFGLYDDK